MADDESTTTPDTSSTPGGPEEVPPAKKTAAKKATAKKSAATTTAKKATAKKAAAKKAPAKKSATEEASGPAPDPVEANPESAAAQPPAKTAKTAKKTAKKTSKKTAGDTSAEATTEGASDGDRPAAAVLFQAPEPTAAPAKKSAATKSATAKKTTTKKAAASSADRSSERPSRAADGASEATGPDDEQADDAAETSEGGTARRRRRRGGRRRRKSGDGEGGGSADGGDDGDGDGDQAADVSRTDARDGESGADGDAQDGGDGTSRRRRRRRREGDDGSGGGDDPQNTVTRVRKQRSAEDEITAVSGSTRLEAKKQRRREGREAGRRRAPIVSEAEFLARRESVDRVMVIRQRGELTQIGVLEDKVLVEHYVARESQTSLIGNVYLGRVQNVLPSMEAAFVDIGKGRNAVLYAGEVNWSSLGHKDGAPRKIESVLTSGQMILVQVTKDPVGHKGARLTSQVSLAGRFLVYVPDGTTSGISRKLPDTERSRLKNLLKEIVPETAGVIVRTAAEGASEDELTRDVERLKARWEDIDVKAQGKSTSPQLLYGEPDLTLKVVRDLFTEDFNRLVIQGDDAWDTVQAYVAHVAPDLQERLERYEPGPDGSGGKADVFAEYRIEEQIAKGLDRKVWLPSGGSLVIDRTEAMTVVDVNTGKFTGSGGNLEETVTKNNLEAAEEIVRQLRLRDIGGIIVVDFIDMVLESNRDLVLRRLVECLGRDRTRHQVAEVTSLGLVQMTRKRIGTGLLESFSENCEHCQGRGVVIQEAPVEPRRGDDEGRRSSGSSGSGSGGGGGGGRRSRGGRGKGAQDDVAVAPQPGDHDRPPTPKDLAAIAKPEPAGPDAADPATSKTGPTADSEPAPAAERAAEPATAPEQEPAPEAAGTPPAVADVGSSGAQDPTEPPKVVTRTRRRAASRPASTAGEAAAIVVSEPSVVPDHQTATPPPPPKVVTRTRGQRAPRTSPAETTASVEHVPIKKKGARKR